MYSSSTGRGHNSWNVLKAGLGGSGVSTGGSPMRSVINAQMPCNNSGVSTAWPGGSGVSSIGSPWRSPARTPMSYNSPTASALRSAASSFRSTASSSNVTPSSTRSDGGKLHAGDYINKLAFHDYPFSRSFVRGLFANVSVAFVGDSLMRTQYKDLITFINGKDALPLQSSLKSKNEASFMNDQQVAQNDTVFNGPLTKSARIYQTEEHLVIYKFISRCLNEDFMKMLTSFVKDPPDVLILGSALWDVTRNGCEYVPEKRPENEEREALEQFVDRMSRVMIMLHQVLRPDCLVIWVLTPTISESKGRSSTTKNFYAAKLVSQANYLAAQIVQAAGYDVIDLEYYLSHPMFDSFQTDDGVHWYPEVVRLATTMLIERIAKSWNVTDFPDDKFKAMESRLSVRARSLLNDGQALGDWRSKVTSDFSAQIEKRSMEVIEKDRKKWVKEMTLLRMARIRSTTKPKKDDHRRWMSEKERKKLARRKTFDGQLHAQCSAILPSVPNDHYSMFSSLAGRLAKSGQNVRTSEEPRLKKQRLEDEGKEVFKQ